MSTCTHAASWSGRRFGKCFRGNCYLVNFIVINLPRNSQVKKTVIKILNSRFQYEYYLIVFCFQYELLAAKFIQNSLAALTVAWFLLDSCGIDESASNIGWYIVICGNECRLGSFAGSVDKIRNLLSQFSRLQYLYAITRPRDCIEVLNLRPPVSVLLLFATLPECSQNQTAVSDTLRLLSDF